MPTNVAFLPVVRFNVYSSPFTQKVTLPVALPETTAIISVPFCINVTVGVACGMLGKNFLVLLI